jgi:hypothetical protein
MPMSIPAVLELAWAHALPGKEAAAQNELLREVLLLLQPRTVPHWFNTQSTRQT